MYRGSYLQYQLTTNPHPYLFHLTSTLYDLCSWRCHWKHTPALSPPQIAFFPKRDTKYSFVQFSLCCMLLGQIHFSTLLVRLRLLESTKSKIFWSQNIVVRRSLIYRDTVWRTLLNWYDWNMVWDSKGKDMNMWTNQRDATLLMNDLYYSFVSVCFGLSPDHHQEHHPINCITHWYVRAGESSCCVDVQPNE